jgi:hypothetical protein
LPHSPQALLLYFTSVHTPLHTLALLSQQTQALFTQWPLLHWLSWVQVLGTLALLLDEDAPPEPPPALPPALPPPEGFPALPPLPLLLDELLLPALLLPAWLLPELLLELPPAPALDELLLSRFDPPLELKELLDDPPEDLLPLLLPPSPPGLSELLLDLTAQVMRTKALAAIKPGKYREVWREENIALT